MIPLTLPGGFTAYGASEADPVDSADKTTYWGMDTALNGRWYGYTVWKQAAPGVPATKVAELLGAGQGRLKEQPDGKLYASAYPKLGDATSTVVVQVPGYAPPPISTTVDATARQQAAAAQQTATQALNGVAELRGNLHKV